MEYLARIEGTHRRLDPEAEFRRFVGLEHLPGRNHPGRDGGDEDGGDEGGPPAHFRPDLELDEDGRPPEYDASRNLTGVRRRVKVANPGTTAPGAAAQAKAAAGRRPKRARPKKAAPTRRTGGPQSDSDSSFAEVAPSSVTPSESDEGQTLPGHLLH